MTVYNNITEVTEVGDTNLMSPDKVISNKEIVLTDSQQLRTQEQEPELAKLSNFLGSSGIINLTEVEDTEFGNEDNVYETQILIKKNSTETYVVGNTTADRGYIYKITNDEYDNPELLVEFIEAANQFTIYLPCFKGDELHIVYTNNISIKYCIYDTVNEVFILNPTTVTTGIYPQGIRYNQQRDEVSFVVTTSTNNSRIYSVTASNTFVSENSQPIQPKRFYINKNFIRCDTHGTNNFYDDKMYFLSNDGNKIFSYSTVDFSYTLEKDITSLRTLGNLNFTALQCTTAGTFYFSIGANNTTDQLEIFYAQSGDLDNPTIIIQNGYPSPTFSYLYLLDDASAIIKYFSGSGQSDVIDINYNLSVSLDPFEFLTTVDSGTDIQYTVTKDTNKFFILYNDSFTLSIELRFKEFTMNEADAPVIIPAQPTTPPAQLVWTLRRTR